MLQACKETPVVIESAVLTNREFHVGGLADRFTFKTRTRQRSEVSRSFYSYLEVSRVLICDWTVADL